MEDAAVSDVNIRPLNAKKIARYVKAQHLNNTETNANQGECSSTHPNKPTFPI